MAKRKKADQVKTEHAELVILNEPPTPEALRAGERFDAWFRSAMLDRAQEFQNKMVQSACP